MHHPRQATICRLITGMILLLAAAHPAAASETDFKRSEAATTMSHSFFQPPARAPHYAMTGERGGYRLLWRERTPQIVPDWDGMHMRVHSCQDEPICGPWLYNWAMRRDPCALVSGDLPRVALLRTWREPTVAPPFHKLGDLRIRVLWGGQVFWLDEEGQVSTEFRPWGTVHRVDLRPARPLAFTLETFLVDNRALAAELTAEVDTTSSAPLRLELYFGGLDKKGAEFIPPYLLASAKEAVDDQVALEPAGATLTDATIKDRVRVTLEPAGQLAVSPPDGTEMGGRLVARHELPPGRHTLRLLAQAVDPALGPELTMASFEDQRHAARAWTEGLLAPLALETPDHFLDAAFDVAALDLEYLWQPPAWLEGFHEWPSYYCNNYQISAAIDVGRFDRARDALLFFGERPGGPAPVINADGSLADDNTDSGLPYFILQLWRYWRATGDRATLDRLWRPTCENLEKLLHRRDPEGNGLLGWAQGCNAFLYQADHLGQPGDAPSPTLMLAGNLEQMAELAEARGETAPAAQWRDHAAFMKEETLRRLWRPAEGRLTSVDTQGRDQWGNYYTDFVFPVLYGRLPAEYQWVLLRTLDRTLWVGDHLMRSGNFKPPLFSNDMMAPVQMSEAAEAYFAAGRNGRGWALLHGSALAATVFTDSPGSFPEYLTQSGWGQADYIFGNPAAAYAQAVVGGLFGLERRAAPAPLAWQPAIPAQWDRARLKTGDIEMTITGQAGDRRFELTLPVAQAVMVRLPLEGGRIATVTDVAGQALACEPEPHPGGGWARLTLPPATHHVIHLVTAPVAPAKDAPVTLPASGAAGQPVEWALPAPGVAVDDPQGVFNQFRVDGPTLRGTLSALTGPRTFFLNDRKNQQIVPVDLDIPTTFSQPAAPGPLVLAGRREPLDLTGRFNTESFNGRNAWRFGEHKIDLSAVTRPEGGRTLLDVGSYHFQVLPTGRNILGLELGALNGQTMALYLTGRPRSARFEVNRPVKGIELLLASEVAARLTGMAVGELVLEYADGWRQNEPLVYGRQIDGFVAAFAKEVAMRELAPTAHVAGFAVAADATRPLAAIELRVTSPEAFIGLLAVNWVLAE